MQRFDLGHLEILQALLETQSVRKSSEILGVTPSAVSRSLSKIRASLGDKILVPAGRDLVLTKKGLELCQVVKWKVDELHSLLTPAKDFDPLRMKRQFHIRTGDYSSGLVVDALMQQFVKIAPLSSLILRPEGDESSEPLRSGEIDLDIGVKGNIESEFMSQVLFQDHYVAVFSKSKFKRRTLSLDEFCAEPHLIVSRKGASVTLVDAELRKLGRSRKVLGTLAGYREAFETAMKIKCIVSAPERLFENIGRWYELVACPLPVKTPSLEISQTWHPRHQADPEHLWLREQVRRHLGVHGDRKGGR